MTTGNIDHISDKIKTMDNFLKGYSTDKIVGVTNSSSKKNGPWVNVEDSDKHIFIKDSSNYQDTSRFVWDIIHEISHLATGSKDIWYIQPPLPEKDSYSKMLKMRSAVQSVQLRTENVKNIIWDGKDIDYLDRDLFLINQDYRVNTIMENADSISLLIARLNDSFDGPSSLAEIAEQEKFPSARAQFTQYNKNNPGGRRHSV
jgi:hypothetical protein